MAASFGIKDVRYSLHKTEGDQTASYEISDEDSSSSSTQYFGYVTLNGYYIITEHVFSAGVTSVRYAFGRSGYTTAWTNRASLVYDYFYNLES